MSISEEDLKRLLKALAFAAHKHRYQRRKDVESSPCLHLSVISMFPFSALLIEEQHRIVAKVYELMSLCDTLKTRLNIAQTTQLLLADVMAEWTVA